MTQHAWLVTIRVGLIAGLLPACTHTAATSVRPAEDPQPALGVVIQPYPGWPQPTGARGGEETQSAPPDTTSPLGYPRAPYNSLLPPAPDPRNPLPIQQADGILGPDGPSLLISHTTPDPLPGSVREAPPPVPAEDKTPPVKDEPAVLALRSFLNDKPAEALEHLKRYDAANQEALICLTATVARLAKKNLDQLSPTEIDSLQQQLQKSLLGALRPRAELVIEQMHFCEWIEGYGNYRTLPPDHEFQPTVGKCPGEPVQVYLELRNLTNEVRGDAYETRLESIMHILDSNGNEVRPPVAFPDRETPTRTLTPLPNFFKKYGFWVPNLPPGTYTLTFEVRDITRPAAPRVARKSLEFRVAAPANGS